MKRERWEVRRGTRRRGEEEEEEYKNYQYVLSRVGPRTGNFLWAMKH